MKRFIDLRGQIIPDSDHPHFAFYCTVVDRFESFNGEQAFSSKEEFLDCCHYGGGEIDVERYTRLMPEWVPENREGL